MERVMEREREREMERERGGLRYFTKDIYSVNTVYSLSMYFSSISNFW